MKVHLRNPPAADWCCEQSWVISVALWEVNQRVPLEKHWTAAPGQTPCSLVWHFSRESLQVVLQGPSGIISSNALTYSYHTHGVMYRWALYTKSLQKCRRDKDDPPYWQGARCLEFQCSDHKTWMHLCWPTCQLQRSSTPEVQPKLESLQIRMLQISCMGQDLISGIHRNVVQVWAG